MQQHDTIEKNIQVWSPMRPGQDPDSCDTIHDIFACLSIQATRGQSAYKEIVSRLVEILIPCDSHEDAETVCEAWIAAHDKSKWEFSHSLGKSAMFSTHYRELTANELAELIQHEIAALPAGEITL